MNIHFRLLAKSSDIISGERLLGSDEYLVIDKKKHPIDEAIAIKEAIAQVEMAPSQKIVLLRASHCFEINPKPSVITTELTKDDEDIPF